MAAHAECHRDDPAVPAVGKCDAVVDGTALTIFMRLRRIENCVPLVLTIFMRLRRIENCVPLVLRGCGWREGESLRAAVACPVARLPSFNAQLQREEPRLQRRDCWPPAGVSFV